MESGLLNGRRAAHEPSSVVWINGKGNRIRFNLPCTVTTNSTPLINIIERKGVAQGRYFWGANREIVTPGVDPAEKIQNQNLHKADINMSKSFQYLDSDFDASNNEASFDFTQDIFFIFSYADELK